MTDNKKYFWLKLKHDFFQQKEIKKLRKIAGGDTYTLIYLELLLLSIKNEGVLKFEGTEDSLSEQLALEINEDEENIKITLCFLEKNNLVEISNNDYFLKNSDFGKQGESTERVRRFRQKTHDIKENRCIEKKEDFNTSIQKSHLTSGVENVTCNANVTDVTLPKRNVTPLEIEKELELELDLKDKKHINNNKPIVYIQKSEGENSFVLENIKKTKPATKQRTYKDPFEKLISELNPEDAEDMKKITNLRIFEKCVELLYRLWDADRKGSFLKVKQSFALSIKNKQDVFEELYKLEKATYVYFNTRTKSKETGDLIIHNLSNWSGLWENYNKDYYEKLSNKKIKGIKRGEYWKLLDADANRQEQEINNLERIA